MSNLWERQREAEIDWGMYNSKLWMLFKVIFGICILTIIYLLYALHELPWTLFGSVSGLLILGGGPLLVGLVIGFSFDNMKKALALGIIVGMISLLLFFIIFRLPYDMHLAEYDGAFMLNVWFYLFIAFIDMISFVPAGVVLGAASNMYD